MSLFFFFSTPALSRLHFFRNPFPPGTVPSLAILSSVFLWFIYRLFLPRVLPSPASHAQAGTPRCTLSTVALWKVNNSVSVPAATAPSSSVWLRRVSAAITHFNLLPRASRLQVASFSSQKHLCLFLYQKKQGMTAWCSEIEQSSSKKLILCPQKKASLMWTTFCNQPMTKSDAGCPIYSKQRESAGEWVVVAGYCQMIQCVQSCTWISEITSDQQVTCIKVCTKTLQPKFT